MMAHWLGAAGKTLISARSALFGLWPVFGLVLFALTQRQVRRASLGDTRPLMALVMRPDLDWDDVHVPGSEWRPLKEAGKAAERVGAKVRRKAAPAAAAAAAR